MCSVGRGVPRGVFRVLEHPPQRKLVGLLTNFELLTREEATHTTTEIYDLYVIATNTLR